MRATALSLSAVLAITGAVVAQDEPAPVTAEEDVVTSPPPERQSNRISVRVAEALDNDPEAIYRFVADHVLYEPYSGLLRGDSGAFFSRAGNSVDQASLLSTLLGAAGIETRYAVGAMADDTAAEMLSAGVVDVETLRELRLAALGGHLPGQIPPDASLPSLADAIGFDDGAASGDIVTDWVRDETTRTLAMLDEVAGEAGITFESDFSSVPQDEIDQHTWIQASIDEAWVDLDPSLPSLALGDTVAEVSEVLDEVPAERAHTVDIAVFAESVEDGALVVDELLRVTDSAAELDGKPIVIANIGGDDVPNLTRAFEKVLGVTEYHPVIQTDGRSSGGDPMTFTDPASTDGGGLGGGFFDTGSPDKEATAEWIEITLFSPGHDPVTVRRDVFDRIGEDVRAVGRIEVADLPPLETVDVDEDGTGDPAPLHWISWLTVSTGVPSLLAPAYNLEEDADGALSIVPFTQQLVNALAGHDVAAEFGVRPFADAPNITSATAMFESHPNGQAEFEAAIDIWHRNQGVLPMAGGSEIDQPAAVPGVIAHLAERVVAGEVFPREGEDPAISVGSVMDAVSDSGIGLRLIDTVESAAELPYEPEARSVLERSVAEGWLAVAPERPVAIDGRERVGWWLIDPLSGRVSDQFEDGRGSELFTELLLKLVGGFLGAMAAIYAGKVLYQKFTEARDEVKEKVKASFAEGLND
jgi:hypothetical protein